MSKTSFNVEDVNSLLEQINEFCETLQQEWNKVSNQWSNLKSTWHDEQFNKFEPIFEKMLFAYEEEITKCKSYTIFLAQQIKIAQQRNNKLVDLTVDLAKKTVNVTVDATKKTVDLTKKGVECLDSVAWLDLIKKTFDLSKKGGDWLDIGQKVISLFAIIPLASISLSTEPISPVEQQMIAEYKSLPLTLRSMTLDEQLEESFQTSQETSLKKVNKKQRKRREDDEEIASS
ncbi:MAG: hypothetical protein F6K41_14675 [Symploca sp. SIO3E6]|nr:hypothetical protein [Caldora sp. SIO3E6]